MNTFQNQRIIHYRLQKANHEGLKAILLNIVHIFIEIVLHVGILKKSHSGLSRLDLKTYMRISTDVVMTHGKNLSVFWVGVNFISEFIKGVNHPIDAFIVAVVKKNNGFSFSVISKEIGQIVSRDFSYEFIVVGF